MKLVKLNRQDTLKVIGFAMFVGLVIYALIKGGADMS